MGVGWSLVMTSHFEIIIGHSSLVASLGGLRVASPLRGIEIFIRDFYRGFVCYACFYPFLIFLTVF